MADKKVKKLPMNERNFVLKGNADGHNVEIKLGPSTKDGGIHLDIYMKDKGVLKRVCELIGRYDMHTGECVLDIDHVQDYDTGGVSRINAHQIVTQRDQFIE